jgi:hypothetical protein
MKRSKAVSARRRGWSFDEEEAVETAGPTWKEL